MKLKKIFLYGLLGVIVLAGLSMLHGGLRKKVVGNFNYATSIRSLDLYELECSDENLAAFDGQIKELLKIPRMTPYTGERHDLEGKLIHENDEFEITFSTVGMYADHWQEKPSIRVDVLDQPLKNGLSQFGFLRPVTRNFLGDWIAGILSEDAGLINLKRELVAVSMNGDSRKAFLMEETFRGYSNRKSDKGFALKYIIENDTCTIKAYNDSIPKSLILQINKKITEVLSDPSTAGNVFDLSVMAKFYAINDLTQGFHQLVEFNTHFFYNYKTGLLEPMGREWNSSNYLSEAKITTDDYLKLKEPKFLPSVLHQRLLENSELKQKYIQERSSLKTSSVKKVLKNIESTKAKYVKALWKDLGEDSISFDYLFENLKFIQKIEAKP